MNLRTILFPQPCTHLKKKSASCSSFKSASSIFATILPVMSLRATTLLMCIMQRQKVQFDLKIVVSDNGCATRSSRPSSLGFAWHLGSCSPFPFSVTILPVGSKEVLHLRQSYHHLFFVAHLGTVKINEW